MGGFFFVTIDKIICYILKFFIFLIYVHYYYKNVNNKMLARIVFL